MRLLPAAGWLRPPKAPPPLLLRVCVGLLEGCGDGLPGEGGVPAVEDLGSLLYVGLGLYIAAKVYRRGTVLGIGS